MLLHWTLSTQMRIMLLCLPITLSIFVCCLSRYFLQFFIPTARTLTTAETKIFISAADGDSDGRLGVDGQFLIYLNCVCTNVFMTLFYIQGRRVISVTCHLHWQGEAGLCLYFNAAKYTILTESIWYVFMNINIWICLCFIEFQAMVLSWFSQRENNSSQVFMSSADIGFNSHSFEHDCLMFYSLYLWKSTIYIKLKGQKSDLCDCM